MSQEYPAAEAPPRPPGRPRGSGKHGGRGGPTIHVRVSREMADRIATAAAAAGQEVSEWVRGAVMARLWHEATATADEK